MRIYACILYPRQSIKGIVHQQLKAVLDVSWMKEIPPNGRVVAMDSNITQK